MTHRLTPSVGASSLANRVGTELVVREQACYAASRLLAPHGAGERPTSPSRLMVTPHLHARTNAPSPLRGEGWGEEALQQNAATAAGALA